VLPYLLVKVFKPKVLQKGETNNLIKFSKNKKRKGEKVKEMKEFESSTYYGRK
jgi:hypothetical protein